MAPPKMPKIHSAYIYPRKKAAAPEKPCTKRDHKNQEIIMKKSSIDKWPRIFKNDPMVIYLACIYTSFILYICFVVSEKDH